MSGDDAAAGRGDGYRIARALAGSYACPDCDADTELEEPDPGVYVLHVRHDATCPTLAKLEGRRR